MSRQEDIKKLIRKARAEVTAPVNQELESLKDTVAMQQSRINELVVALEAKRRRNAAEGQLILQAAIEKYKCEPVDELLRMATEKDDEGNYTLGPLARMRIMFELAAYRIPKVKQTETHHEHDHNINVVVQNFGAPLPEPIDITPRIERGS